MAFFYCRDQDGQRNNFAGLAKAVLAQLLRQNPNILPYLYDECLKSGKVTLATSQDCIKLLKAVLQAVPQTILIIDGIDECNQKERKTMLNFFTSLISADEITPGKVRELFISQELSDIKSALHMADVVKLKDHNELDIRNYAENWATRIQERFKMMPDNARAHIVRLVCQGADGMFLFARLVLENLYDQESLERVYNEMHPDTFPHGFDQAYVRRSRHYFRLILYIVMPVLSTEYSEIKMPSSGRLLRDSLVGSLLANDL